jgi:hypothetical protein
MSTQRRIEDFHVGYAFDGIQSALGYLPAFTPEVKAIRDKLQEAMTLLAALEVPVVQPGWEES